ncbi:MAG TPA: hemerythrin domain-containing protein [Pyrinomonadaceae bacterium]|jgi:iron-sulfur cluster repair protein YtfE (RIC family)
MKNSLEFLLESDHESLGQLLAKLDAELGKPNCVRAFELLDLFWARLAVHIRAENLHLFPALNEASALIHSAKDNLPDLEEVQNMLLRLRSDHDFFMKELSVAIKSARTIAACEVAPPKQTRELRQRLTTIAKRLEVHNKVEEEQVYLWPSLLLDEPSLIRLSDRVRHELENLPPRVSQKTEVEFDQSC